MLTERYLFIPSYKIKHLFKKRTADYNGEVDIEDWWVTDFTLEELLELRLVQQFEFRDQSFNNLFTIPTFEEYCQLAQGWFLYDCTEFIITEFSAYDSYDMHRDPRIRPSEARP